MKGAPPLARIRWADARRIVSSRHPPVAIFEDIADPADWELILAAEAKTDPAVAESVGRLDCVPRDRRVSGPGASHVMAPFVHASPNWAGRFHDGTFGAFYAANRFETAVAETAYHKGALFRATNEDPGWLAEMLEFSCAIDDDFHDLRRTRKFRACLDPEDYEASHDLARRLRGAGANGVVYPSVRDFEGEAIAAFWPDVVGLPAEGRRLSCHFDGARIDFVRDEGSGDVWRLE